MRAGRRRRAVISADEQAALKCVYLAIISLNPTGVGRKRRTIRWRPAWNEFEIALDSHLAAGGEQFPPTRVTPLVCQTRASRGERIIQVGGDILQEIIGVKGIIDNCIKDFNLAACGWEVLTALPWGKILKGGKIVTAFKDTLSWIRRRDKAMADLQAVEVGEQKLSASRPATASLPGTLVLMADGSRKSIEQLRAGDLVAAHDPAAGALRPQAVVGTIIGEG